LENVHTSSNDIVSRELNLLSHWVKLPYRQKYTPTDCFSGNFAHWDIVV